MVTNNDLEEILAQVLEEVKQQDGKVNLAEIGRRTNLTRGFLRRWQGNGYHVLEVKAGGRPRGSKKLSGFEDIIDGMLKNGITNSDVVLTRLREHGYSGGSTIVKDYITSHRNLVPAARKIIVAPQGNRGRRYTTPPGDCYQMDWGFVNVKDTEGAEWKCACFAMVCHHCGMRYIEFFPNARQENLFIAMIHAFSEMGIPERVLTDNMKSVVDHRDAAGNIVFNKEYDAFQHMLGFSTDLCKVAHPFTKGQVERLVRYAKGNFICGRSFLNVTELNLSAITWCHQKNSIAYRENGIVPEIEHRKEPVRHLDDDTSVLLPYIAPERKISFDGFINYEGRRYGVPYSISDRTVRVLRKGEELYILDSNTGSVIQKHAVDWSKAAKVCPGQWADEYQMQPEELPTAEVTVSLTKEFATLYTIHPSFQVKVRG